MKAFGSTQPDVQIQEAVANKINGVKYELSDNSMAFLHFMLFPRRRFVFYVGTETFYHLCCLQRGVLYFSLFEFLLILCLFLIEPNPGPIVVSVENMLLCLFQGVRATIVKSEVLTNKTKNEPGFE